MRSGPGAARTILLFHTISARPSKQPRMVGSTLGIGCSCPRRRAYNYLMVRTFLKVYMELGSSFLFLQEQIKDIIIIMT